MPPIRDIASEYLARPAARAAVDRCNGVPYACELDAEELRGMASLERTGDVMRDENGSSLHWHRRHPPTTRTSP